MDLRSSGETKTWLGHTFLPPSIARSATGLRGLPRRSSPRTAPSQRPLPRRRRRRRGRPHWRRPSPCRSCRQRYSQPRKAPPTQPPLTIGEVIGDSFVSAHYTCIYRSRADRLIFAFRLRFGLPILRRAAWGSFRSLGWRLGYFGQPGGWQFWRMLQDPVEVCPLALPERFGCCGVHAAT